MNPDIPIRTPKDLSPPSVKAPVNECARKVFVTGFLPHAKVQVYSNTTEVLGDADPHFGFAEIALNRPVQVGDLISATQTVNGIESAHSLDPVMVSTLPTYPDGVLPQPDIASEIFDCGRIVPVNNLVPGATVIVEEDNAYIGSENSATTSVSVVTSRPLTRDLFVDAQQFTCKDVPGKDPLESLKSSAVQVSRVPDPFLPPRIDEDSNTIGNDSITLNELYVGAEVAVYKDADATEIVGSGLANASTNWVPLKSRIETDWSIVAEQTLCDSSANSDPASPSSELKAPQIIGPICDSDHYVRISNTVINATVVLRSSVLGQVVGHAGATPGVLLLPRSVPLIAGDQLTVFQYLESNVSPSSDSEVVCACSDDWLQRRFAEILSDAKADELPVACNPSDIELFKNDNPWDIFECTLRADFDTINGAALKEDATSTGKLSYTDPVTALPVNLDCIVSARGNTRFQYCGWRPLKIRFPSNPDGSIFDGTGKVIKIVTHCGFKAGDQWILGGTATQHKRRFMQEYSLYQVLNAFNAGSLHTRLARINYQDLSGANIDTQFAFFREREKRAAERCGFERVELDEGDPSFPPNVMSEFQIHFHHKFLYSHDYSPRYEHNVIRMKSPADEEHYIPYDFDLSGVIRPDYFKNNDWTIAENGEHLISFLSSLPDQDLVRVQIASLLQHEDEMYLRLQGNLVDAVGDARLMFWLDDHIRRLKCYLN